MDEQPAVVRTRGEERRTMLAQIYDVAVDAVRGEELIRTYSRIEGDNWIYEQGDRRVVWPLDPKGRLFAIGAGKAAASLLAGLESVLGERLAGGCAIVKKGHHAPLGKIELFDAGHPIPDEAGAQATERLLAFLKTLGPHDNVFVALTGGASALMVAPADGLTLADKAHVSDVLLASGANISEINTVRKQLSRVKGGRLLDAIHPAHSMTLMISDIPSDDPAMIGSGPTMPDSSTSEQAITILERYGVLEQMPPAVLSALRRPAPRIATVDPERHAHIVLADSQTALSAAQEEAAKHGYFVKVVDAHLDTETHAAARVFASAVRDIATGGGQPAVLLAAGETTLKVTGSGCGGRNQEFALVAALALDGIANTSILASGTDGTDGPTDAAGAFVDGDTIARAHAAGLDAEAMLANNDSNSFFAALGDLHMTGPTGTNVMDLIIGVVD